MKRWTAFLIFPDSPPGFIEEEIDVDAETEETARAMVEEIMAEDYDRRLIILSLEERIGLYL